MATRYTSDEELTTVANAIRTKGGTSGTLTWPAGFVSAIGDIETGVDTSDANATVDDILTNKTAYVNGSKITGTYFRDWLGKNPVLVKTIPEQSFALSTTSFPSWTPSTTAQSIKATANVDTFTADLANYDYTIIWEYECDVVQNSGTTLKATPVNIWFVECSSIYRRAGTISELNQETKQTNATTNYSLTGVKYYNTSGELAFVYYSYGIYATAATAEIDDTASNTPTITIKTPPISARCNSSIMSTARAADIDQTNTILKYRAYVYRVDKDTSFGYALADRLSTLS